MLTSGNLNRESVEQKLYWLLGVPLLVLLLGISSIRLQEVLVSMSIPGWARLMVSLLVFAVPVFWLVMHRRTKLALTMATVVLLLGDRAPALISPAVGVITFSNFIYLLSLHRRDAIMKFLVPFFIVGIIYMWTSVGMSYIHNDIMISYGRIVNLGFLGAFGGFLLIYHIMYLVLGLYHFSVTDRPFLRKFLFILSLVINLIVFTGFAQFVMPGSISRVSSIMRLATRLAPFIVASLPLFVMGLMQSEKRHQGLYWWASIILAMLVLFITQTRGAMGGLVVIAFCAGLGCLRGQTFRNLIPLLTGLAIIGIALLLLVQFSDQDFFYRYQFKYILSGLSKRFHMLDSYMDALQMHQTSGIRSTLQLLFGYGWFSERLWVYPLNYDAHNTVISAFNTFGVVGGLLYFLPYGWLSAISAIRVFKAETLRMRVAHGMILGLMLMFLLTGLVHNKFYSPIESAYHWLVVGLLLYPEFPRLFPSRLKMRNGRVIS